MSESCRPVCGLLPVLLEGDFTHPFIPPSLHITACLCGMCVVWVNLEMSCDHRWQESRDREEDILMLKVQLACRDADVVPVGCRASQKTTESFLHVQP